MRNPTRRGLFGGIAAVAAAPVAAASVPHHPDAELLQLGEQLIIAWRRENEGWAACKGENDDDGPLTTQALRLAAEAAGVVDQIEATPATTLLGVLVKMRALAWCRVGDPVTIEDLVAHGEPSTDMLVVVSLLRDLSAMGGVG